MKHERLSTLDVGELLGLRSVVVQKVRALTCPKGHEPLVAGDLLETLQSAVVDQMLGGNFPLGGIEIRFLRKALGFTQQRLADLLGVTRVTVARWEALEEEQVDMPVSIALRTVLGANAPAGVTTAHAPAHADRYREPPQPHPEGFVLVAPAA
jgi:DNA-binding transcriptional regulator YiaG